MAGRDKEGGTGDRANVTRWWPASRSPWEPGVYERQGDSSPFACWTGTTWMEAAASPAEAALQVRPNRSPTLTWRGLAAPSGLQCATCKGHGVIDRGYDTDRERNLLDECPDC